MIKYYSKIYFSFKGYLRLVGAIATITAVIAPSKVALGGG